MKKQNRIKTGRAFCIELLALITVITVSFSIASAYDDSPRNFEKSSKEKLWIYFRDKGPESPAQLQKATALISERALQRRQKSMPQSELIDETDLPLYKPYIDSVRLYVGKVRVRSRWLNAVSVVADDSGRSMLEKLSFVRAIEPVRSGRRIPPDAGEMLTRKQSPLQKTGGGLDYGQAEQQVSMINIPALHDMGYFGQGVLVCLLDDGFNLINQHVAFDSTDVIDTYDFINDDSSVDDSGLLASEGWHGTNVLSVIGGYDPGNLIGPAFRASYLLAKTEDDFGENPVEEDYWVAGIEWAEAKGADIVSSSLGYIDWYTYEDVDGKTAVTTLAAEQAARKGVLVVISAGNEGSARWRYVTPPADGPSVLAVAAVNPNRTRASYSSLGPTYDGRIKPDLAAMGSAVVVANSRDIDSYRTKSGTSLSCPLVSGAAAVLLSAYPELTAEEIRYVLRETASQADNPDTLLGWGIIDLEAAFWFVDEGMQALPEQFELKPNYPNPFNQGTTIAYRIKNPAWVGIHIYDVNGRRVKSIAETYRSALKQHEQKVFLDGQASGVYFYQVIARDAVNGQLMSKSGKMVYLK